MFRHILVATDGTDACAEAVKDAAALAHAQGARLTALHVRPLDTIHYPRWEDGSERSLEEKAFRSRTAADSELALSAALKAAARQGVQCEGVSRASDAPWQAIIDTAATRGCDLVVMAHHVRKGLAALLGESETDEVIAKSTIPVLVLRAA